MTVKAKKALADDVGLKSNFDAGHFGSAKTYRIQGRIADKTNRNAGILLFKTSF